MILKNILKEYINLFLKNYKQEINYMKWIININKNKLIMNKNNKKAIFLKNQDNQVMIKMVNLN